MAWGRLHACPLSPLTLPAMAGSGGSSAWVGAAGEPTAPTQAGARQARAATLPRHLTSFVARERELEDITRLLGEQPLVTLTGTGGVGKTRLALRAAASVSDGY